MTRSPLYLQRSRHNVYYFRMRVPLHLVDAFGLTHIKRSLGTRNHREALVKGAQLLESLNEQFQRVLDGQPLSLTNLSISHGNQHLTELEHTVAKVDSAKTQGPLISEVLRDYLEEQQRQGVSLKTISDKRSVTELFIRIVGDLPVSEISREEARKFKSMALRLPPRINRLSDKPPAKLIEAAKETISITTFNNYVKNLNTVFGYAETEGYIASNPFKGLRIQQKQKANTFRARFTNEDVSKIQTAIQKYRDTDKYYRYWLPILGMYTGARLNELCQLYLSDFVDIDGIQCIHFQATHDDQSLKTPTSERVIPIHSKLVDLGLLDLVEQQRALGHERLFHMLSLHKQNGYSQSPSRWFARLRTSLGFNDAEGRKDFHSFRHTVADSLKQLGVSESVVAGILGHANGGITFQRYGKDFSPHVLTEGIDKLKYS